MLALPLSPHQTFTCRLHLLNSMRSSRQLANVLSDECSRSSFAFPTDNLDVLCGEECRTHEKLFKLLPNAPGQICRAFQVTEAIIPGRHGNDAIIGTPLSLFGVFENLHHSKRGARQNYAWIGRCRMEDYGIYGVPV